MAAIQGPWVRPACNQIRQRRRRSGGRNRLPPGLARRSSTFIAYEEATAAARRRSLIPPIIGGIERKWTPSSIPPFRSRTVPRACGPLTPREVRAVAALAAQRVSSNGRGDPGSANPRRARDSVAPIARLLSLSSHSRRRCETGWGLASGGIALSRLGTATSPGLFGWARRTRPAVPRGAWTPDLC